MRRSIKKHKKELLFNFKRKNVIDNPKFWKTVKLILLNKLVSSEKITLVEKEEINTNDKDIAKVLNHFFSNIAN